MFAQLNYDLFTVASLCAVTRPRLDAVNLRLTSITNSSIEVKEGSLFVPLTDKRDGHDFIEDAIDRGAAAFFIKNRHPVMKTLRASTLQRAMVVDEPLSALGQLAHFHRMRFTPFVVGVTGSNGKTTTKEMLAQIFRRALGNKCVATEKNYNNHIGLPFTLFAIRADTRVAVLEMGMNHAGEIAYLSRLAKPHAAIISSIGHAHIEFFKSRAGIAAAKAEITEGMHAGGFLYVPHNVAEFKTLSQAAKKTGVQIQKIKPGNYPIAEGNAVWLSNFSLAAAAAKDAGVDAGIIHTAAQKFKPAAGRMQLKKGYFTVIDDGYNANPDSAVASIDAALAIAKGGRVVCVFGDFKEMGRFSRDLHAWTGSEAAKKKVAAFYGVGNDMRHAVAAFKKQARDAKGYTFERSAVDGLVAQLKQEPRGSVILVKGSRAMKMEEIVATLTK